MNAAFFAVLKTILELSFLVGCGRALWSFNKKASPFPKRFLPVLLVGLFVLPFFLYAAIGTLIPKFGHIRNFLYLLPLYFLLIFYGLEAVLRARWLFYAVGLTLICFLVTVSLTGVKLAESDLFKIGPVVEETYRGRALLRLASELEAEEVFVPYTFGHTPWVFNYYMERFHASRKVFPYFQKENDSFYAADSPSLPTQQNDAFEPRAYSYTPWVFRYYAKGSDRSGKTFPYFRRERPLFFDKPEKPGTIAVVENGVQGHPLAKGGKYSFGGKSLGIKDVKTYRLSDGPGGLYGFFSDPPTVMTVYFLINE